MESALPGPRKPYLIIRPPKGWAALDLHELWQFRDLLLTLAARDVKLRYRQTALGVVWVVLQPLLLSGIFTIIFGVIGNMPTGGLPPFLFSFAGLLGYAAFNSTLTKSSISLIGNAHLVSKVYFPRMAMPLSTVFSALIDFGVSFVVVLLLMALYHVPPTHRMIYLPAFLALFLAMGVGFGLLSSALTVSYRDVQYIVPVFVTAFQLFSPIGFDTSKIPARVLPWYMIVDPLAGLVEAFRWSLLGGGTVHWGYVVYSAVFSLVALLVGAIMFKRMERKFADVI
ncbi:MAG TPA: ABC transporter permease [Tepidisphaeraceae bacterium]|nr:ABC transporter permease [Tepidisphaeraceae bacterium]